MALGTLRERARELMEGNYRATGGKYVCPSWPHYGSQWLWDSCFHAIICSELGLADMAKNEVERLLAGQREDGWIPHILPGSRRMAWYISAFFPDSGGSAHTQPPVLAQAVEAIGDPAFARKVMPSLERFYLYFSERQDPDGDGLVSVCHPHETGRDTSLVFSQFEWEFSNAMPNFLDVLLDLVSRYRIEYRYSRVGWDIARMWKEGAFDVEDVMFNCIWVDGLRSLQRMSENPAQRKRIRRVADRAEAAVIELCWDEGDRTFYGLDSKNRKIRRADVSSLFPLLLDGIPERMHRALVERLTDPREFWTPYPVPTAPASDPGFDPHSGFYCNWRGPVWVNMNWFIARGLAKHGYSDVADALAKRTAEMVGREGFREFYDPFTGKGMREASRGFGWSGLAVAFPKARKGRERRRGNDY